MTAAKGKGQSASRAEQLIAGTKLDFANAASIAFAGGTYTPAQIETSLQTLVDLRAAVDAARATLKEKVAAETAQAPSLRTFMSAYATFVKATFGEQPGVLAHFGLVPRKAATPLTPEEKVAAAAKRKATRAARHTMGPKQKLDVVGNVTGVTVTPVTAPVAATPPVVTSPAPVPAPAAPATVSAAAPHAS
jgi:hypothetical protein